MQTADEQEITKQKFKSSNGWRWRFCKRWQLSSRMLTHILSKLTENSEREFYSYLNNI